MATETSVLHRDQANAYLLAHRLPEVKALKAFIKPPGLPPGDGWLDELLNDARQEAKARHLGAWGTIEWLLRSHCLFVIEDTEFHAARDAAPHASPEALVCWVSQWRRPELWLAALGFNQPLENFPALLKAVLNDDPAIDSELLAVVMKCALQAAYDRADWKRRDALAAGEHVDTGKSWARHEWPTIADSLIKALITKDSPAVKTLITEMLCDYRHGTTSHDRGIIDKAWNLRLAAYAPEEVFSELLSRITNTAYGEAALEATALITQLQSETRSERAKQVFHVYLQMPWTTWRWKSAQGRLSGLLANCLKAFPEPLESWREAWKECNPGAPEGWPIDLNDYTEKHAAAVHLELVGILASLDINIGESGQLAISDPELLNVVGNAIHDRLVSAAGHYEDSDGHVLQVYWSVMGDEVVMASCRQLNDLWVHERRWELTSDLVRFAPLIDSDP